MDCSPPCFSVHGIFPGKNTEVGCHFLLQGIFLTQGLNLGLLHCRQFLYCPQGSPNELLLAVCESEHCSVMSDSLQPQFILYLFSIREMILGKNQISEIFLFEFKMGCKAVETTCNINTTFGPGAANEHTVRWWFKRFCKGDKSLEDEYSDQPSDVNNNQENHRS